MAQPVTPQDHIQERTARMLAQQQAAKDLAAELAAQRAGVELGRQVEQAATEVK